MEKITLTKETIDAIIGYKQTLLDKNYFQYQENCTATFYQGDYIIDVNYDLYMEWVNESNPHAEMASHIPEDLSHWLCYRVAVREVFAFDNDGNDLEITKKDMLFKW